MGTGWRDAGGASGCSPPGGSLPNPPRLDQVLAAFLRRPLSGTLIQRLALPFGGFGQLSLRRCDLPRSQGKAEPFLNELRIHGPSPLLGPRPTSSHHPLAGALSWGPGGAPQRGVGRAALLEGPRLARRCTDTHRVRLVPASGRKGKSGRSAFTAVSDIL